MPIPAIVVAGAKVVGATALAQGTSFGLSKLFGGSESKKLANVQRDIGANTQHAINQYNQLWDINTDFGKYLKNGFIDDNDKEPLAQVFNNQVLPAIQQDPYFGGLGNSYTSRYTGILFNTVPNIGIAQLIDNYIVQKNSQGSGDMTEVNSLPERGGFQNILDTVRDLGSTITNAYYDIQDIKRQGYPANVIPAEETPKVNNLLIFGLIGLIVFLLFLRRR